jgi:hypothetical protein
MRRSRLSDEQIAGIWAEQRAGMSPATVCRMHGIGTAPLYD